MDGQIVETYEYDVAGSPVIRDKFGVQLQNTAVGNFYMFTARQYDPETGNYYYRARYYSPTIGRFLQSDPIGYKAGLNLYAYCGNNPIIWIDPLGLEVSVQTHNVTGKWYHTSVRITPENQEAYKDDPRFNRIDEHGRRYATLGAEKIGGKLISNVNRPTDVDLSIKVQNQPINLGDRREDDVISELFARDSSYTDDLNYAYFPKGNNNNSYANTYNSNSYTRGLVNSVGLQAPQPSHSVPGYNNSVPRSHFNLRK